MKPGNHWHYAYGLEGYGPNASDSEGYSTYKAGEIANLAIDLAFEVDHVGDGLYQEAIGLRDEARGAVAALASGVRSEAAGTWESIADDALRALEAHDRADECTTLEHNLKAAVTDPDFGTRIERLLGEHFPLSTQVVGGGRLYVWECDNGPCCQHDHGAHVDYPHQPGYMIECGACQHTCHCSGEEGHTPCVHCQDIADVDGVCQDDNCSSLNHN